MNILNQPLRASALSLVAMLIISSGSFAQTATSNAGNWSAGGNWTAGVPAPTDDATVGHSVMNIDQDLEIGNATWTTNGRTIDATGGSIYKITIKNASTLNVNAYTRLEGDMTLENTSHVEIGACDTLEVGAAIFKNNTSMNIPSCGVLIICGDLTLENSLGISCDGEIIVKGNVHAKNSATITGTGTLTSTGTITIDNSASLFGNTGDCTTPPCVLDIDLLSFEANAKNESVELVWVTASEKNNDFFTLERSTDGQKWDVLFKVKGAGNSNVILNYLENDNNPVEGLSYYRLKQTDYNGLSTYSPSVPVKFSKGAPLEMSLFPNPVKQGETVNVSIPSVTNKEVLLVLRDVQGKKFYSKVVLSTSENTLIGIPIDSRIPKGTYLIIATSDDAVYSKPVIIL